MSYPVIGKERLEETVLMMSRSMDQFSWLILSSDPSPTLLIYGIDKKGGVAHRYMDVGNSNIEHNVSRGRKVRRAIARFLLRAVA